MYVCMYVCMYAYMDIDECDDLNTNIPVGSDLQSRWIWSRTTPYHSRGSALAGICSVCMYACNAI